MLYKFKSRVTGDLIMLEPNGRRVLEILGKDPGAPGIIEAVDVDTAHFKGNFPDRCSIQAANVAGGTDESLVTQAMFWAELLPEQKLSADHVHTFRSEVKPLGRVTHVRFNIFPDGGVSRLRLWGRSS